MRKIIYLLMTVFISSGLFYSCHDKDEIIFDHEKPQFEIKNNAILLEIILPQGTTADDEIYIVGDFNGGKDAIGNLDWKLEKSDNDKKWGIYLYPNMFKEGKDLGHGFYFVSSEQGVERTLDNEDAIHTLEAKVGTQTNIWVTRWEAYFGNVEKDNYTIYVEDNSGWDALAIYAWGDDGDVTSSWPGLQPTGTKEIKGVNYTCFEFDKEITGIVMNLIFNNNGGGKQFDGPQITLKGDLYLRITDTAYEVVDPNNAGYLGYTIYIEDNSDWDALAIYAWGDNGDVTPGWPGIEPTGTKVINGTSYIYFEMGENLNEKTMNLIFNNNGGGKQFDGPQITLDKDFYLKISSTSCEIIDPNESSNTGYIIYIENNSGWGGLAIYGYFNDTPVTPAWHGVQSKGTKDIDGITYIYFEMGEATIGKGMSLIFNDNNSGANQFDGPFVTLDNDLYFKITADGYSIIDK